MARLQRPSHHPEANWRGVGRGPRIPADHGSAMHPQENGAEHAQRIVDECTAAAKRGHRTLYVHLHCTNSNCCVKYFSVTVDYQYVGGYAVVHPFACPYCGRFAVLDADYYPSVEASAEYHERDARDARRSVWRQVKYWQDGDPLLRTSDLYKEVDIERLAALLTG